METIILNLHLTFQLIERLYTLYKGNLNNIDLFVGGMLESENGRPGELFRKIIKEQFERLRDADRFWFENTNNGLFTKEEVEQIRKITLWDVIVNASDNIPPEAIQKNVFVHKGGRLPDCSHSDTAAERFRYLGWDRKADQLYNYE